MTIWLLLGLCVVYLISLFGVAYYAERKSQLGKSLINNPIVYALSLTTYCTAWTFYGSVGKAATTGIGFLPTYLGPIILAGFWYILFKWVIRICKIQRITSIADFIGSRYGKSGQVGILVSIVSILAIVPYISLQLKAISQSFDILYNVINAGDEIFNTNTGLITAILMSVFIILFGTRKIDASERQEGMVFAIAFEALFKLVAFLVIGVYVTFYVFDGLGDIFQQASDNLVLDRLISIERANPGGYFDWFMLINLSFLVFMLLPRQFYLIGVQNTKESHADSAGWLFTLYLLLINIFIIPIALAGLVAFQGSNFNADTLVLMFPLSNGHYGLSILVFFGGFAAATGMIIASAYALSMMLTNNIILPKMLPVIEQKAEYNLPKVILWVRRFSIIVVMVLSYSFLLFVGEEYPLVEIGLISFVGIAQLAPSFFGAIFWKKGNRKGVMVGMIIGVMMWIFTLLLPTIIRANIFFDSSIMTDGIFGYGILRPYALFGYMGMGNIVHGMFWSLLFNAGSFFLVSIYTSQDMEELEQASQFSAIGNNLVGDRLLRSQNEGVTFIKTRQLLNRFFGVEEATKLIQNYSEEYKIIFQPYDKVTNNFIEYTENLLTGVVGSATSRMLISKIIKRKNLDEGEIMSAVSETRDIISHSKELEEKSKALEITSAQLQHANERLKELDRMKDNFIASVSHELRTPLTSIRSFAEMLSNKNYNLENKKEEFLGIIVSESVRLSNLIDDILYFEKLVQGESDLIFSAVRLNSLVADVVKTLRPIATQNSVNLIFHDCGTNMQVELDENKVKQVLINIVSNAIKFADETKSEHFVKIQCLDNEDSIDILLHDNGIGITRSELDKIFNEFYQVETYKEDKPVGSGLGLAISKKIVTLHKGSIQVDSKEGEWTEFEINLPKIRINEN